jgi:hypothetical protein
MAKAAEKPNNKAVATTAANAALPAYLKDQVEQDANKGTSQNADDNIVPLIYVLQAQSPQCNKRSPDYVEGAETGALWLRNSGLPAISGETGIIFQPCFFQKDWVEWKPNRGGFAGRHPTRPEEAEEKTGLDPNDPERIFWVLPNGNIVQETRYHIGIVYLEDGRTMPYVIPLSGSGHTVSKSWMFLMNSKTVGPGKVAPSFAALYRLKTRPTSNAKGEWMILDVTDAGWVANTDDYERGKRLHDQFVEGEKQIAEDETAHEAPAGGAAPQGDDAAM